MPDPRARRAARWLAPSAAAACAGAIAYAGAELARGGEVGGALGAAATIGYTAIVCVPALVGASTVARGALAAWQPARLADRLVEDGGGAPLLAAWALVAWLAAIALSGALFQGVWLLANQTAWKPLAVSLAVPMIAVGAVLAMLALAWPAARALAWLLRRADARWRRGGRGSLLAPRAIAVWIAALSAAVVTVMWLLLIGRHVDASELVPAIAPAAAIAAALAVHVAWRRASARARAIGGGVLAVASVAALACALLASPGTTLSIWGNRPLAGLVIERLSDLDDLRAGMAIPAPVARAGAGHPDLVLVTIDGARADHTPPYNGSAAMPALADLGQRGAVFEWAFAPSSVPALSLPAIAIGVDANRVHAVDARLDPRHVLLAERLAAGGYDTAGFLSGDEPWGGDLARGLAHVERDPDTAALAALARAWLDARAHTAAARPLFVWIALRVAPASGDDDKHTHYDAALSTADAALATVLGAFSARAPDRAPIAIVTAPRGDGLGEHNSAVHGADVYDSQTRVPLVIAGPGIHPGRVAEVVGLVDLVPTVLELAGFSAPRGAAFDGHAVADLATGARVSADGADAFITQPDVRDGAVGMTALVHGSWKLVSAGGIFELYDIHTDPKERLNFGRVPARARLVQQIRALLSKREAGADVSPFP